MKANSARSCHFQLPLMIAAPCRDYQSSFCRFWSCCEAVKFIHVGQPELAHHLNQHIETFQATTSSREEETQVVAMSNLRDTVKAAASTIHSATTVITSKIGEDRDRIVPMSDFGDCFPAQHGLAMRRWMDSRTVYEYEEVVVVQAPPPESVADVPAFEDTDGTSDSDAELDNEMIQLLFERGKEKLYTSGDAKSAEKILCNCPARLVDPKIGRKPQQIAVRLEVVEHLYTIYLEQEHWSAAQDMLSQKWQFRNASPEGKTLVSSLISGVWQD